MRLWGFLSYFCPLVLECLGVKSGMSFLLRKPCKTGSTWSITASPQRMSFLGMSNWGGCFSMALGAGVVRGPNVNWPLPPGRFLQGSISCCVVSNSLTRDSLCDAEVRAVVASRSCWPPQQVVVLVYSVSLWLSPWELVPPFIMLGTLLLSQRGTYSNEMNLAGMGRPSTVLRAMTPFPEGCTLILAFFLPGSDARRRVRGAGRWAWGVFTRLQPGKHTSDM